MYGRQSLLHLPCLPYTQAGSLSLVVILLSFFQMLFALLLFEGLDIELLSGKIGHLIDLSHRSSTPG